MGIHLGVDRRRARREEARAGGPGGGGLRGEARGNDPLGRQGLLLALDQVGEGARPTEGGRLVCHRLVGGEEADARGGC